MALPKTEIEKCDFIPDATIMEILRDTKEPDFRELSDIVDKAKEAKGLSPEEVGRLLMSQVTMALKCCTHAAEVKSGYTEADYAICTPLLLQLLCKQLRLWATGGQQVP